MTPSTLAIASAAAATSFPAMRTSICGIGTAGTAGEAGPSTGAIAEGLARHVFLAHRTADCLGRRDGGKGAGGDRAGKRLGHNLRGDTRGLGGGQLWRSGGALRHCGVAAQQKHLTRVDANLADVVALLAANAARESMAVLLGWVWVRLAARRTKPRGVKSRTVRGSAGIAPPPGSARSLAEAAQPRRQRTPAYPLVSQPPVSNAPGDVLGGRAHQAGVDALVAARGPAEEAAAAVRDEAWACRGSCGGRGWVWGW